MASTISIEGIKAAHTNQTSHFDLHMSVTAELKSLVDQSVSKATVQFKFESAPSTFTYEISYTPTIRGRHELTLKENGVYVSGRPFHVFVHHPPTQLGKPFKVLDGLDWAVGVTVGARERVYIARVNSYTVSVFDKRPVWIQSIGEYGKPPFSGNGPQNIATDDYGNMYITTMAGCLLKIGEDGKTIRTLAEKGSGPGQFDLPWGVKVHNRLVYVCDVRNHRVQVFDMELNFVRSFGDAIDGSGKGFDRPRDLAFDTEGKIYICEYSRVQVVDENGRYLYHFGQKNEGAEPLMDARGIAVFGGHVYISEYNNHCVSVFKTSGEFITSFGKKGSGRGELNNPHAIDIDSDGFVYVCDRGNQRVQVF